MTLDLRPDNTALAPTEMVRNDQQAVPFAFPADSGIDPTGWLCQVRRAPDSTEVAATWTFTPGAWADLSAADQAAAEEAGADDSYLVWFLNADSTGLEGSYVWDVQDGDPGNTVMGPYPLEVAGDVTQPVAP